MDLQDFFIQPFTWKPHFPGHVNHKKSAINTTNNLSLRLLFDNSINCPRLKLVFETFALLALAGEFLEESVEVIIKAEKGRAIWFKEKWCITSKK